MLFSDEKKAIFCSNPIRPTGTYMLVGVLIILCYFSLIEASLSQNYIKVVWDVEQFANPRIWGGS